MRAIAEAKKKGKQKPQAEEAEAKQAIPQKEGVHADAENEKEETA